MVKQAGAIKIYFASIPAHKFLHIKDYESKGYWDFWERQDKIPGMDCDTICGLLDSVQGKLDGEQIMAHISEDGGKRAECYGVKLPTGFSGEIPPQMLLIDIPEGEYIVFEHGPFDYEQENDSVGWQLQEAIKSFDYSGTGYEQDESTGRPAYFHHDPDKFCKRVIPVKRKQK